MEEKSMKLVLKELLKQFPNIDHLIFDFNGKDDLRKNIEPKINALNSVAANFVILQDQDRGDCIKLKAKLQSLVPNHSHNKTIIRIVCRELESWFLADFDALIRVYGPKVNDYRNQQRFRNPDELDFPVREIETIIPNYSKGIGSAAIASHLNLNSNRSPSFQILIRTLDTLSNR
ncbi:MAG: DUF4276 family protein [Candidatus Pacebacteria bacterium]|nr:DUF4276 family protein [Candidatus Paceibacterota bacterium]